MTKCSTLSSALARGLMGESLSEIDNLRLYSDCRYNIPDFVCDIYFGGQSPCLGGVLALDGR